MVEQKAEKTKRTDFVKTTKLEAGSGDKVELELLETGDVSTMDFKSRMALWSEQVKQKRLTLQPKLFTEDMVR